jgi:hypothetical protein
VTTVAAAMTLKKPPNMKRIPRRLTSPAEYCRNICPSWRFMYICKIIRLWCFVLTICLVIFNLRRSCKLGLRRMCCHYKFIMETCSLVVKHGVRSKSLTLNEIFLISGSKFRLNFRWIASIFLRFSFFVKMRAPLLRTQALQGFWRRSPLAPSLLDSISRTLVTL